MRRGLLGPVSHMDYPPRDQGGALGTKAFGAAVACAGHGGLSPPAAARGGQVMMMSLPSMVSPWITATVSKFEPPPSFS